MKFHHLGVACDNHEVVIDFLQKNFGDIAVGEAIFDPLQKATVQMITLKEGTQIELISGETVAPFIRKNTLLYHTCWGVHDIGTAVSMLVSTGARILSEPKEAILFGNAKVAFLASDIGIIELVEESE